MAPSSDNDTIAAIATPLGQAGIGMVRLSGPKSREIIQKLFQPQKTRLNLETHRLYLGRLLDPADRKAVDEVLVSFMQAPHSYTREDVVEINAHSGYALLSKILSLVLNAGARLAKPGEFTFRAFKNGRIELTQAEAVMDLINAKSEKGLVLAAQQLQGRFGVELEKLRHINLEILAQIEAAIDFSEDTGDDTSIGRSLADRIEREMIAPIAGMLAGFEQRKIWLEGVKTVILGRVNVGKSSLLNQLANEERAIVTPIPGTTRDIIETFIHIAGVPFRIMDTAGFRKAKGEVEKIGLRLTQTKTQEADLILLLIDQSRALHPLDLDLLANLDKNKTMLILNKTDLPTKINPEHLQQVAGHLPLLKISALTGAGLDMLRQTLLKRVVTKEDSAADITPLVPNLRHKIALEKAGRFFQGAVANLKTQLPPEIIALDLHAGSQALAEIIGETTPEHVLEQIFSQFCIGK